MAKSLAFKLAEISRHIYYDATNDDIVVREFNDQKSIRPAPAISRKKDREGDEKSSGRGRGDEGRRSGKLTLSQALDV